MLDELRTRAADAVEMAKAAGADDAWAKTSRSREVEFQYRDGKIEKVQENTSRALSLQLYVDGRFSGHSTTDLRPDQLKSFVADAVALTRALQPDPFRTIPDPALFEGRSEVDLDLIDPKVRALTREERMAWLEEMYAKVKGEKRLISSTTSTSDGHTMGASASSNGFAGDWERTSVWLGLEVTLQDDGDARPEGWMFAGGRHRADVPECAGVADRALQDALARLGSEKGPTTRTTMIVDPRAAGRLMGRLLSPASGRAVQQSQSFWAGNLGKKMVSDKLSIIDNPLLKRGLASRHFDGEGISAKEMPLIEAGVFSNLYLDTYYAKKLERKPTSGSASNQVVVPGTRDIKQIIADCPDGVYVTSWLGGNADPTTGDFSFGMRGHPIKDGKIGGPIGEMNVTGNLVDLFTRLIEVGSDPWPYATLLAPTLVFEGVQFSGS